MPVKPSEQEEEYFARQEFERRKQALAEQESRAAEEERLRILAVARDRCPKCGAPLVAVPFRGWSWTSARAARASGWTAASWTK